MQNLKIIKFDIGDIAIKLSLLGFSTIKNKSTSQTHYHPDFEYHFIMSDNSLIKLDEQEIFLQKNSAILISPMTYHKFLKSDTPTNALSLSFSIKQSKSGSKYFELLKDKLTKNSFFILKENSSTTDIIHQLISTIYSKKLFITEETSSRLTLLFTDMFSEIMEKTNISDDPFSTQEYDVRTYLIENYFDQYYMQKISLEELSKTLYLSTHQTSRIIKKIYNNSFRGQLTNVRIKSAMELLIETNISIVKISEMVGYESYPGFYSAFKKITGTTPEKWRAQLKNKYK